MTNELGGHVVTIAQMKEIERRAAESGLSYPQMMENAGTEAAKTIQGIRSIEKHRFLVFCGKGNNGGDGFVAARKLREKGAKVKIILADGDPRTEDAKRNKEKCEGLGIPMLDLRKNPAEGVDWAGSADVYIDAIYGTGFHGTFQETVQKAARLMNQSKATVFALDIPSGLHGDTGDADADTVRADYTISFHRFKIAHLKKESAQYCGELVCVDIGIRL